MIDIGLTTESKALRLPRTTRRRQVQERVKMTLVVSMGERLYDSTVMQGDWGQFPLNYPNLRAIPVSAMPYPYCSPIGGTSERN